MFLNITKFFAKQVNWQTLQVCITTSFTKTVVHNNAWHVTDDIAGNMINSAKN